MNQPIKMRRYKNEETDKDETIGTYKRDRLGVCELDRTCARRCRNRLECNRNTNNRDRRTCPSRCDQFARQRDGPGRRVRCRRGNRGPVQTVPRADPGSLRVTGRGHSQGRTRRTGQPFPASHSFARRDLSQLPSKPWPG